MNGPLTNRFTPPDAADISAYAVGSARNLGAMIRAAIFVAAGGVTLMAAQSASAGTFTLSSGPVTLTCGGGICSGSFSTGTGGGLFPQIIDIPYFGVANGAPSGEVLTSVSIEIIPTATLTSGNVSNLGKSGIITAASLEVANAMSISDFAGNSQLSLNGTGIGYHVGGSITVNSITDNIDPNSLPIGPGQSGLAVGTPQSFTGFGPIGYSTVSALSAWTGSGFDPLTVNASPSYTALVTGGSTVDGGGSVVSDYVVNMAYNYTAAPPPSVPEPAEALVLASGLVGLVAMRRRRG